MITQTHRLDVVPGGITTVVHVKQYQTDESLVFDLFSRFGDFAISAAFTECTVRGTKSDGNGYSANATCDPSNNSVTVQLTEQMTAVAGRQPYELTVTDSTGRMITTTFILDVHRAALDADTVESESVIKEVGTVVTEYLDSGAADDIIDATVEEWMDNHPEATTTVEPDSITSTEINHEFLPYIKNDYVTPEMFGAVGDGVTDDTEAISKAFETGENVLFGRDKSYAVSTGVSIQDGQNIDLNNATIISGTASLFMNFESADVVKEYNGNGNFEIKNGTIYGGEILLGHGRNIAIRNINFRNSRGAHSIQMMSCTMVSIESCSFAGVTASTNGLAEPINLDPCAWEAFRGYGEGSESYDGTPNRDIFIHNCHFAKGTDTGFDVLSNAIGGHYHVAGEYLERIYITNNVIDGATYAGFRLSDFRNSVISGNTVISDRYAVIFAYGTGNVVTGNRFVYAKNDFGGNTKAFRLDNNEENLSLFGNVLSKYGTNNFEFNEKSITFRKADSVMIASGTFSAETSISLSVPYTTFDTVEIMAGYKSGSNLRKAKIECWPGDMGTTGELSAFSAPSAEGTNDTYPIDGLNSGATVVLGTDGSSIKINNAGTSVRYVWGRRG